MNQEVERGKKNRIQTMDLWECRTATSQRRWRPKRRDAAAMRARSAALLLPQLPTERPYWVHTSKLNQRSNHVRLLAVVDLTARVARRSTLSSQLS